MRPSEVNSKVKELLITGKDQEKLTRLAEQLAAKLSIPCHYSSDPLHYHWQASTPQNRLLYYVYSQEEHLPTQLLNTGKVAIIAAPQDHSFALKLLEKGFSGCFYQGSSLTQLLSGARQILEGKLWFGRRELSEYIRRG